MYAFLSHGSACEALRTCDEGFPTWPPRSRRLPLSGDCVSNQRSFKALSQEVDLTGFGVVSKPVDLLVPGQAMRSRGKEARFHVWSGVVPAHSMRRISRNVFLSGPELVVAQLCGSHAKLDALFDRHARAMRAEIETLEMLGVDERPVIDDPRARDSIERLVAATMLACEFAGTYRLGIGGEDTRYHVRPLMDAASMNNVVAHVEGTSNRTRTAEVAGLFFERSASPMETALALMLTLPVNFGGMGLPRPELNSPVDVSDLRGVLSDRDTVTPDMLWRSQSVAVEYDSAEFHGRRGAHQLDEDARRSNILTAKDHKVLRVTPGVMGSIREVELFARQLAHLLDVTLAQPTDIQALRRRRLFALLVSKHGE